MKKILVPVDFSEYSLNAIEVASYIAKVKDMKIEVMHVMEDLYTPYFDIVGMGMMEDEGLFRYKSSLQESIKSQLEQIVEKIREKHIEAGYEIISDGKPFKAIIKKAMENDVDLIVMGSHGNGEFEDIFIGSNAEKVFRTSAVPVLSVHKIRKDFRIDRIVFASDFEEAEVELILERVIKFAEIFMAELFLLRVNTPSSHFQDDKNRKRLEELSAKFRLPAGAVTTYSYQNEEEGILNYAREVKADLITLCTHGRTGLAQLFKGSIAEEVVGYSEIPVLTYNISKDKISRASQSVSRDRNFRRENARPDASKDANV